MGATWLPNHNCTRLERLMPVMEKATPIQMGVMECACAWEDEPVPMTFGEKAMESVKFIVCGALVIIGCLLMAIGAAYCWFYWFFQV